MCVLSAKGEFENLPNWVAIAISVIALLISAFSLFLQYKKQRWISAKIVKYDICPNNSYVILRILLTNVKNRKHSISHATIQRKDEKRFVYLDSLFLEEYVGDFFQEGESKSLILYAPYLPQDDFCIEFHTDGKSTKITPKTIRKYRKENHLSPK